MIKNLLGMESILSLLIGAFMLYFPYMWCNAKKEPPEGFGLRWFMTERAWHDVIFLTVITLVPLTPIAMSWPGVPYKFSFWATFELLGAGLAASFIEETFFRGWLQTILTRKIGAWRAIFLTSLLFALTHLIINPSWARLATFFPGLLMGWLRWRHGSVMPAILYHAFGNVWSVWWFPR